MLKKFVSMVYGKDCELRERMLRALVLAGSLVALVGIIEMLCVVEINTIRLLLLSLMLLTMGVGCVVTFKYSNYNLASMIIGIVIMLIVFPMVFLVSGGIRSGAAIWMSLGILYMFVMFNGRIQRIFVTLAIIIYGGTYLVAYMYPEILIPMEGRAMIYVDSFFSLVVVGLCSGLVLYLQMKVYEQEHKINLIQREELEKSSDSKNVFFANMSHEIRSPINTIIGLNEMILRSSEDDAIREYANDIQIASMMLLNQVNDILDLSQMEMQKMTIVPDKYNTLQLFSDLVDMVKVQMEKKELAFHVDIDPDIPSVLIGDEKRIKQVVLNILDNAIKYTKEGSVALSVQSEDVSDEEVILKVKVADTGIGIHKEDIGYLYDSFSRVDEKKNKRIVGSGLGLAITKQLVDLMGGQIKVDSIYTKGSTFTVMLKQKIANKSIVGMVDLLKKDIKADEFYRHSFEAPEARILLVDDNEMNAVVACRLLSETKVQIDVAHSGAECLEMARKKYYHLILLDYMMPEMNGCETLKALRSQENSLNRETPVVALTANTVFGARQVYLEQGFDSYLEKPIKGKSLELEVLEFLPRDIIEYLDEDILNKGWNSKLDGYNVKKRKKIYITSDCCCDLPEEMLDKYDIKMMYLYIRTPQGRFADTREIDSDSLSQYTSSNSSNAYADSVTVEEYEGFFAEALTQAESVIHISLGSRSGKSYDVAVAAAKCFDNVHIIDSGQVSCGQGLVALYAAKLAMEGKLVEEICEEVEKMTPRVQTMVIMPGADIFHQNGRMRAITAKACRMFQLHPMAVMKNKKPVAVGLLGGTLESAWKQGIRWHLRKKRRISSDVVIVTYVSCSVKQQEWIVNEIKKRINFKKLIMQKASFSTACNVGIGSVAISYYSL